MRLTRQRRKTLAPGPALERTLSETLDGSLALSAEAVSSHLRGHLITPNSQGCLRELASTIILREAVTFQYVLVLRVWAPDQQYLRQPRTC